MTKVRTIGGQWRGERMKIRKFSDRDAMHKFLNTSDNANHWIVVSEDLEDLPAGTYAWAGGRWHNVRELDASVLAHI